MEKGTFIVSLDYEIMWGAIFNKSAEAGYRYRTPYVQQIYPRLLDLFKKYEIHATWAVVGGIACTDKEEALGLAPSSISDPYGTESLKNFIKDIKPEDYYLYFDRKSVVDIYKTPYQEVGSHTFSHFYFYEHSNAENKLIEDLRSSKTVIEDVIKNNITTLIMPKNQVDDGIFTGMRENNFSVYRGAQISDRFNKRNRLFQFIRFVDAYLPVRGDSIYSISEIKQSDLYNVRASWFWRTYDKRLALLEPLKLWRIKTQLKHAAQKGKVFHLWFHPHNLSADYERNLETLEKVFIYYSELKEKYGMRSLNMKECADESSASNQI